MSVRSIVCVCGMCGCTNMWHLGMHICPWVVLCSPSLADTSALALQLADASLGELSDVCVCLCSRCGPAHYCLNPRQPGILPRPSEGDLKWRSLPARAVYHFQRGVCASISVSFQRPPRLVEAPLGMRGTLPLICVPSLRCVFVYFSC